MVGTSSVFGILDLDRRIAVPAAVVITVVAVRYRVSTVPTETLLRRLKVGTVALVVLVAALYAGYVARGPITDHVADLPSLSIGGGCEPFALYAQSEFEPRGARLWAAPSPTAESRGSVPPNGLITVDGWVRARSPYPSNTPPWDSDVWFHLADDSAWVTFAGVRSDPTAPNANGSAEEGSSVPPTDPECASALEVDPPD